MTTAVASRPSRKPASAPRKGKPAAITDAARETVDGYEVAEVIQLSPRDQATLLAALEGDGPEPEGLARLRRAMRDHDRLVESR